MNNDDLLDQAFGLLRAGSSEPASRNLDLEEGLMKEFANANRNRMPGLGKMAVVVLLCITVGGVAVAATGGFGRFLDIKPSPDAGVLDVNFAPGTDALVKPSPNSGIVDAKVLPESDAVEVKPSSDADVLNVILPTE